MGLLTCLFVLLVCYLNPSAITRAQDSQAGFISIDCGAPEGNYEDPKTGLRYSSDQGLIDTGESKIISSSIILAFPRPLMHLRSFPKGVRNCYILTLAKENFRTYLIRAVFCYGNYDGKSTFPKFDIYLGVSYWRAINITGADTCIIVEIIHVPPSDFIDVCLADTGNGTPFISTLELRPLNDTMYQTSSGSLALTSRLDYGNSALQELTSSIRYHDDIYDRIWLPRMINRYTTLNTSNLDLQTGGLFKVPSIVMRTAITPLDPTTQLTLSTSATTPDDRLYFYFHFAEVQQLQPNQSRQFFIYLNGEKFYDPPITPLRNGTFTVFRTRPETGSILYNFSFIKTESSTLQPILNAVELYKVIDIQSHTDDKDAAAMLSIKSTYGVTRNWQGDPCAPQQYMWDGLNCSYNGSSPPRIISLNLSSTALVGDLAAAISNLTKLETLDLSNNQLSGQLPGFLGELASLRTINLKGNSFTGRIPSKLLEGNISLSVDDYLLKKKKNATIPAIAASVGALSVVLISFALIWMIKRKRQGKHVFSLQMKKRRYKYSEIQSITKNFQKEIGKGGYGTVYYGHIGEKEVAVKMYSSSKENGFKELQSEANVLLNVHHKNLTSLIGYYIDGTHFGIIYEYMYNGDLRRLLSDQPSRLSWLQRIEIVVNAAEGLEYMHHSCKPPIVHRDVKSSNILLNAKLEAKIADFGLSRTFPNESVTHMSTAVAGTLGYLDPRYHETGRLTEKSDVYSFGVVLHEIITGKPAIIKDDPRHLINVTTWVSSFLQQGDVKDIVDPTLKEEFDVESAKIFVQIAMLCVSQDLAKRPTMTNVVSGLKACLTMELNRNTISNSPNSHLQTASDSSLISMNMIEEEYEETSLNGRTRY